MIRKFILRSGLFLLLPVIAATGFYYMNSENLAAKRVTNSYSFNEKINWLPSPKKIDILTLGSSMSFNNISSSEIVNTFNTDNYINASSWGVRIADLEKLIPMFYKLYNPDIIICASNIVDFEKSFVEYDLNEIVAFISNKQDPTIYDLLTDKYYFKHTIENKSNFTKTNIYTSLAFDNYGGVQYAAEDFKIVDSRWNKKNLFEHIDAASYDKLQQISEYLHRENVEFIFIQTPVRSYLQDDKYYSNISKHTSKIQSILESNSQFLLDFSHTKINDSLFVDHAHLNSVGADSLTRMICRQYMLVSKN